MPLWAWIIIIAAAGLIVLAALASTGLRKRRTSQLQRRFGPEYDRTVEARAGRREGERELRKREKRHQQLEIKPLAPEARERYLEMWRDVQGRFVDDPDEAVHRADELVTQVMRDRGYPMDDFGTRAGDISVEHPHVVEHYRAAHRISRASDDGGASTEQLRQATVHYRELFEELLETRESAETQHRLSA
jgi:hypothetical protein